MKIALDLENVVADMYGALLDYSPVLSESNFQQWEFEDGDIPEQFYCDSVDIWQYEQNRIDITEPVVPEFIDTLTSDHLFPDYTVDIVSNTHAFGSDVVRWLSVNDIEPDSIVTNHADFDKSTLDYDIYIDDDPRLAGDVDVLYLYDQPWNQSVRGDGEYMYESYEHAWRVSEGLEPVYGGAPNVIRVTSLSDVFADIVRKEVVGQ